MRKLRSSLLQFSAFLIAILVAVMAAEIRAQVDSVAPQLGKSQTLPEANLIGPSTPTSASAGNKSSAGKSANGLWSLPPEAQGPISAALGKDDPGYWVHRSVQGFRGENPRRALAAEFTRRGAEVRSHNLRWGLETRGYGYGAELHPLRSVAPKAKTNRVEYVRDGVTEWYENGPLGLEQGFTFAHPPGKANGQALTVELGLRGDLVAALGPDHKALELRRKDGEAALRYTGLHASDATRRELRSWLEVRGERLLLRVDDGGARYPVVVDPWIQKAELTASDGWTNDQFGYSVAVSGNKVLVGAPCHPGTVGCFPDPGPGAAYVFVESGGTWSQQAKLTASDGARFDHFGDSVAVSGSTAVVGARLHQVGSNSQQGVAYVFVESGGTWSQQAELTASDGVAGDLFGESVAVSGSTVVVGAPYKTVGSNQYQGAAYVFVESGGTWIQQAELTASDSTEGDQYGHSVAVSGSTALVGAAQHTVGSNEYQGAAYVFVESGGTWSQQAELTVSDGAAEDSFGISVAVDGSTAVVGAHDHTVGSNQYQGAAFVFVESGGTWSQHAELTASDGAPYDAFGWSVAVSGSMAVVGAPFKTVGSNSQQGAAYVFVESGGTWKQQAELIASGAAYNNFGNSVALDGSMPVVGSPFHHGQGSAYMFGSSGPLYTLSAAPNSLSVPRGGQGTSTITIMPRNGFSGSVSFSASGLPNGVAADFTPNPATSASTLTLKASRTATMGTATVFVEGSSGNLRQTMWLMLKVTGTPAVTLSRISLDFGKEAVNNTSASKMVTMNSTGTATLDISSITASGDFAISANTCGATLAVGKNCKVQVTFTPAQLGVRTGTLSFTDNAPNSPQTVSLLGTGAEPATLLPTSVFFGPSNVGTTSMAKTFTLANNQSVALTSIAISTTGDFALSATTCATSLAANAKCTISVTFTPTLLGKRAGTLSVSDSASNSPQTVSLLGTGVEPATLLPASVSFGAWDVGTTSTAKIFTLTNNQSVALSSIAISTTGDFALSATTCATSLAANAKCTISVTFTPTLLGKRVGTLSVSDSASNSPQTSNLTGGGT